MVNFIPSPSGGEPQLAAKTELIRGRGRGEGEGREGEEEGGSSSTLSCGERLPAASYSSLQFRLTDHDSISYQQ